MAKECLSQSGCSDDVDDVFEDDFDEDDEEGLLLKGVKHLKKEPPLGRKKEGRQADPNASKKQHKSDAKNRYLRKHRDDVDW